MKKVLLILVASLIGLQLNAQSKQENIAKLLSVMNSEQMTEKMFDNLLQLMKQQSSKDLNEEQQNELSTFIVSEMKNLTKKAVTEYYPNIFDKYFNEPEIIELIEFYRSATGQKYLQVLPDIQLDLMQNYINTDLQGLKKRIEQKKTEIKQQ